MYLALTSHQATHFSPPKPCRTLWIHMPLEGEKYVNLQRLWLYKGLHYNSSALISSGWQPPSHTLLFTGVARNTLNLPQIWLSIVLSVVLCILPVIGYQFLKPLFWPANVDKVSGTRNLPRYNSWPFFAFAFVFASVDKNPVLSALAADYGQNSSMHKTSTATP